MSDVHVSLPDYLRPPCGNLWRWEDNGDSIVWCANYAVLDGEESTAAFSPQLHSILCELNERLGGLPPLVCVLLVIDVCSTRWSQDESISRIARLSKASSRNARRFDDSGGPIVQISRWFSELSLLPKELRADLQSQIAILSYAFRGARGYLFESVEAQAVDVLECISIAANERDLQWAASTRPRLSVVRAKRAMEALAYMSSRSVDAESLRLWRRTNVAAVPAPAGVEEPPKSRHPIGQTLRELSDDDEWGAVARAAVSVASMLSLPRKPSDPEPLPVGGVSDVTNRGQPERLLMTELAQDPMVMLARIANGQALYLRRETPPGPSPQFRPVLIEAGIRTWGTIRLQIASVALAIAAADERRGDTSAKLMTVAGRKIIEEDFTAPNGVIEHLARLESDEHPGPAIKNWIRTVESEDELFADPILIVSAATDRDQRFRRDLDGMASGYLIARIEADATVTLLRRTPLGDEVLQSVALDAVVKGDEETGGGDRLPKIFTLDSSPALFLDAHPCPLRFTDHLDGTWMLATDTPGLFTITRDRRLLYFDRQDAADQGGIGAVQLVDRIPSGHVLANEYIDSKLSFVIGDGDKEHDLVEIDLRTGDVHTVRLQVGSGRSGGYVFDQGSLFQFGSQVRLFDRSSGACVALESIRPWKHVGGPILRNGADVRLVSRQANQIVYHLTHDPMPGCNIGFALRRRDGMVVLISTDCTQFVCLDGEASKQTLVKTRPVLGLRHAPLRIDYESVSGDLIVASDFPPNQTRLAIDLKAKTVSDRGLANNLQLLRVYDLEANRLVHPRSVLSRIEGIRIDHGESIVLKKRDRCWAIEHDPIESKLQICQVNADPTHQGAQHIGRSHYFGRAIRPDTPLGTTRWCLRKIGIGIYLAMVDSRGLLHLRRGDDLTEVTLMMYMPHVSGWTSWGERFGDGYFLGGDTRPTSENVVSWLKEFARQCSQSN